tara:strand:+ start:2472 stop:3266 length:795 start_codon:yes stop_codon:yes gene_type:complete
LCAIHAVANAFDICINFKKLIKHYNEFYGTDTPPWLDMSQDRLDKLVKDFFDLPKSMQDLYSFPSFYYPFYNYVIVEAGSTPEFIQYVLNETKTSSYEMISNISATKKEKNGIKDIYIKYKPTGVNGVFLSDLTSYIANINGKVYYEYLKQNYVRIRGFSTGMSERNNLMRNRGGNIINKSNLKQYLQNRIDALTGTEFHFLAFRKTDDGKWCLIDSHNYVFQIEEDIHLEILSIISDMIFQNPRLNYAIKSSVPNSVTKDWFT